MRLRLIAAALLMTFGLPACSAKSVPGALPRIGGLFTTLPIMWGEEADLAAVLRSREQPHWAMAVLREDGEIRPVDALVNAQGASMLGDLGLLVMAQPRPLSPQENLTLDRWVRGGGRVLLLADPMLTEESRFALGDKRRPQDVALLSPILTRWGLELAFDEAQPAGETHVPLLGESAPVNLAGHFALLPDSECALLDDGLLAECPIGRGRVLAVADAALLERGNPPDRANRERALRRLLARLR